jgi:hypothetical protein
MNGTMNLEEKTATANRIVDDLIKEFYDRRGLSDEWDAIDSDIRTGIRKEWVSLIVKEL